MIVLRVAFAVAFWPGVWTYDLLTGSHPRASFRTGLRWAVAPHKAR